ncbi:transposase-like protein DUF772 [Nitrosomonas sp. Nm84]|nr:transposase-like protein DUF772 [Nitrosomonas sp. Nm84]
MDNGRASIDPVLFFRMQLISYLFGIESDRQLCRDIHLNLAYRWFCRLPLYQSVPHQKRSTGELSQQFPFLLIEQTMPCRLSNC